MRTSITIFLLLFFNTSCAAQEITLTAGLSIDIINLQWSIAGNSQGQSPNILSELNFNSVTSVGYFLQSSYKPWERLEFTVYYQNNKTVRGHGTDVDYQNDNRTDPTYNLSFSSNKGKLDILRTGVNSPLMKGEKIVLSAGLYYQSNSQRFYILSAENSDLASTYTAKTRGLELVINAQHTISKHLFTNLYLNGGYVNYKAKANWNLQDIFMHPLSFLQTSRGKTLGAGFNISVKFSPMVNVTLTAGYNKKNVFSGTDTSYLVTGKQISTQFNGASSDHYHSAIGVAITL